MALAAIRTALRSRGPSAPNHVDPVIKIDDQDVLADPLIVQARLRNQEDLDQHEKAVMAKRIANRNPSTAKGYRRGQDAWKAWCRQRNWEDGELVRETKLLLFLKDVVIPLRTGGRERRSTRDRAESKRARNAATKKRSRKRKRDESNGKQAEENGDGLDEEETEDEALTPEAGASSFTIYDFYC